MLDVVVALMAVGTMVAVIVWVVDLIRRNPDQ